MGTKHTYHTHLDRMTEGTRNFVLCIDGTWNDPTDVDEEGKSITNVLRLRKAISRDDDSQFVCYFPGVGNQEEHGWLG